ncbi:MAG: hypothetical protein RJB09_1218, partial [Pseudomonadota bacterium]
MIRIERVSLGMKEGSDWAFIGEFTSTPVKSLNRHESQLKQL